MLIRIGWIDVDDGCWFNGYQWYTSLSRYAKAEEMNKTWIESPKRTGCQCISKAGKQQMSNFAGPCCIAMLHVFGLWVPGF